MNMTILSHLNGYIYICPFIVLKYQLNNIFIKIKVVVKKIYSIIQCQDKTHYNKTHYWNKYNCTFKIKIFSYEIYIYIYIYYKRIKVIKYVSKKLFMRLKYQLRKRVKQCK